MFIEFSEEEKKQKEFKMTYKASAFFPLTRTFRKEDKNKVCLENVISSEWKV